MKTAFYLQCKHQPGLDLSVSVAANAFSVTGRPGTNVESEVLVLRMV